MKKTIIFSFLVLQASFGCSQVAWPPVLTLPSADKLPASSTPQLGARQKSSGLESLSAYFAGRRPWLAIPANSEQRQPVYLGWRPRALELGRGGGAQGLPLSLRDAGQRQASAVWTALLKNKLVTADEVVELEGWPARDDDGQLTWTFAWWRPLSAASPNWLDIKLPETEDLAPFLPEFINTSSKKGYFNLFADVLDFDDLYVKPLFGDAVWLDQNGGVTAAWLEPDERAGFAATAAGQKLTAVVLPQPARVNGVPVSYRLNVRGSAVRWPDDVTWTAPETAGVPPADSRIKIRQWSADFKEAYMKDLMLLAGETQAVFPISGKQARFTKKNNIETDNQLDQVVSYLEERYELLGIKTRRQVFSWRGAKQTNLIAVIPGTDHNRPILMADHIDTAFCADIFDSGGKRVSTPGADDNMSAAAALLRAAETFKGKKLARDIWLVHLTGEEFPADDLGARYFISDLLASKTDIGGLVLLDMIGWRNGGDPVFQVNAGESAESLGLAQVALAAAKDFPELKPALRTRFDPRSYLYNTDGLIFSDAGFPVILFNEHINALENFTRQGYHDTSDTSALIDPDYAVGITKIAITTAARLAGMR